MPTEFSPENVRAMVTRAGDLEEGAPTPENAEALERCYAWMDLARAAGVDIDAVIDEVRG